LATHLQVSFLRPNNYKSIVKKDVRLLLLTFVYLRDYVMLRINKQGISRSESNEALNNYWLPEAEVLSRQDMATPKLKRANPAIKIPVPVQNKLL
jgi:hypothetical protein